MEILFERMDDVAIAIVPVEELDAGNVADFKLAMTPVLEDHTKIVLDLGRMQFIDSSGMGAILSCLRKLTAKGGDLKLCRVPSKVRAVIGLVRMHRILDIYPTREDAVRAFRS